MVVLLVLSVAAFVPPTMAQENLVDVGALNIATVSSLEILDSNTLSLTDLMVLPVDTCELTTVLQAGDTCTSIS